MRGAPLSVERRWHALDDGLLVYTLGALRALWIAPLLQWVASLVSVQTEPPLGLPAVFGLLAGGAAAAQCTVFLFKSRRTALGLAFIGPGRSRCGALPWCGRRAPPLF